MILKIYGSTDAETLIKILVNSGYTVTIFGIKEEGPHKEVWEIEVVMI